jgi:Fur family transcriptional regulator, ferric uptake regulator
MLAAFGIKRAGARKNNAVGIGKFLRFFAAQTPVESSDDPRSGRADEPVDTPRHATDIFAVSNDAAREKFRDYLASKGLRMTSQRLAIFEAAFAREDHFTAEELLDHARAIDDSVSRATVYRTLPIMTESALLREVDIGTNIKYYLPISTHNAQVAQVICVDCDKIFEISAPFMEWYGSTVSTKLGLTPVTQRLQVSAHCNALKEAGACKNHA